MKYYGCVVFTFPPNLESRSNFLKVGPWTDSTRIPRWTQAEEAGAARSDGGRRWADGGVAVIPAPEVLVVSNSTGEKVAGSGADAADLSSAMKSRLDVLGRLDDLHQDSGLRRNGDHARIGRKASYELSV